MKKALFTSLLVICVEGMAAECSLDSDWEIIPSASGQVPWLMADAQAVRVRHNPTATAPRNHEVSLVTQDGESYICNSEEITDARYALPQGVVQGSYPRISCAFTRGRELMQFTAVLVKDGQNGASHCADSFFGHSPGHAFFSGGELEMGNSCYSPRECLIYWRVESLDYITPNEGTGQGTGSNDGGNTG